MKHFYLGLILGLSALSALQAQGPPKPNPLYPIADVFDGRPDPWRRSASNPRVLITTAKNEYRINNPVDSSYTFYRSGENLDWGKPFELEMLFEVIALDSEKTTSGAMGLIFAGNKVANSNRFLIFSKSKSGRLEQRLKGRDSILRRFSALELKANQKTELILSYKPVLPVSKGKQAKGLFNLKLNGKTLVEGLELPIYGVDFYLFVNPHTELRLSLFRVKQEGRTPYREAANLPSKLEREVLSEAINTPYSDIAPLITPDGRRLYYSIKNSPENTGGLTDSDDIWYADFRSDNTWSKRRNMGPPLNNKSANSILGINMEQNLIFLRGHYLPDGSTARRKGGISYSELQADGSWGKPKMMWIQNYINKDSTSEYSFTVDGRILVFSANGAVNQSPQGWHKDLYVSFRIDDTTWTSPLNLGSSVNTSSNEHSPFIAADGKTLYFGSAGHTGYGSSDIYMSRRLDDSWTNWSQPENLGPLFNSLGWDAYFTIPASGDYAYMVSDKARTGMKTDILRLPLPEALKPNPLVLIYGRVLNADTGEPLPGCNIFYGDLLSGDAIGEIQSCANDATYRLILPQGQLYEFLGRRDSFFSGGEYVDVRQKQNSRYIEIERDLYLYPIRDSQLIRLNNLFFDTDQAKVRSESEHELQRIQDLMTEYPALQIQLEGHTDNTGNLNRNRQLSEQRAQAVSQYLQDKGDIDKNRIFTQGFGPEQPLESNQSEAGRQANRRVMLRLIAPPRA